MRRGIGRLRAGGSGFSPASLFAAGEQGAWYDPSDFSTMWQDSAGTTPVTATGQPVGKILDKSGRGNHATQATTPSRPLLQQDGSGFYYLSFDGVDDFIGTSALAYSAARTSFIAAKSNAGAGGINRVFGYGGNESFYDDTPGWAYFSPNEAIGGSSRTNPCVFGAVKPNESTATVYLGRASGLTFTPTTSAQVGIGLGAAGPSGSGWLACNIYGVISLSRAATAAEILSIALYLGSKSGVTV